MDTAFSFYPVSPSRLLAFFLFFVALKLLDIIDNTGIFLLEGLVLLCELAPASNNNIRFAFLLVIFCYVFVLGLHLIPGFSNFTVFDSIKFSERSSSYSYHICSDQIIPIFILLFYFHRQIDFSFLTPKEFFDSFKILTLTTLVLMTPALLINYVQIDFKISPLAPLWMISNLMIVCLSEEVLYRGFLQHNIQDFLDSKGFSSQTGALILSSLVFGSRHYRYGVASIFLAFIAGLFYGAAYASSNKILSNIFVHFGLNAIHFFFFSYPKKL